MLNLDANNLSDIQNRLRILEAQADHKPLALVVGTSINALGVVRSLGIERIPVVWLTSNPDSFVNYSRFSCCTIASSDVFYDQLVSALAKLGRLFRVRPVLFLTHDFQVRRVSDARDVLAEYYRFDLPTRNVVSCMLSKYEFYQLAIQRGLTVPATYFIHNVTELNGFIENTPRPGTWVVKPFEKSDPFEAFFGKAVTIKTENQWHNFQNFYRRVDVPILAQSWVEGGDTNVAFCLVVFDSSARCVFSFGGKKIRQFKPEVGNTASAERFFQDEITESTIRFFESHKFVGMGSMEFKYCNRSERFYAIEPTVGRTNLQSEIATVNDYNLPAVYYYGLAGNAKRVQELLRTASLSKKNKVWVRSGADFRSAWYYFKRGQLSAGEWLRPYLKSVSFSVFRVNDPVPFFCMIQQNVVSGAKKSIKLLWKRILRLFQFV